MKLCSRCNAELRPQARFCAACGTSVPVREADPGGRRGAREIVPVLKAWGLLLAINGAIGILGSFELAPVIALDVAGSIAMTLVVALVAWRHEATRDALATAGDPRTYWIVPLLLVVLWGMMQGYWHLLGSFGAELLSAVDEDARAWPLVTVLLIVVVPPVIEEVFFRGVLIDQLGKVMKLRDAWIVQAALFSILHMLPLMFPTHFVMGLAFGAMRLRTGSLWPPIVAHALWNGWVLFQDWNPAS